MQLNTIKPAEGAKKERRRVGPVSYTHLDVYKRQHVHSKVMQPTKKRRNRS